MTGPTPRPPERPPGFVYRRSGFLPGGGSTLHCEKVPLARIAERFGTPLYVYSARSIRERVRAFERAFRRVSHTICYSVKANSNIYILRLLRSLGCGFDIVSAGELQRVAIAHKASIANAVFSGVGKRSDEIELALKAGILLFNVESESELGTLNRAAAKLNKRAQIALRVNPDVPADTHPYISTGLQQHKFGVPISEARRLYREAGGMKRVSVAGVSVHIGSQITDVEPFAMAMERVAELVHELRADGHKIKYVDAGGGLGIDYRSGDDEFSERVAAYAEALITPLRKLKVHLLLEPGRSLVGPAGVLLTRVLYRKENQKSFFIVDAALNDLLRPALYDAYHEITPVHLAGSDRREIVDVVGPICETGDFFARDRSLPPVDEGDLLAILDTGAYGMVLASNYNTRLRPAEILVDGTSVKVIRRRETMADLLQQELGPFPRRD